MINRCKEVKFGIWKSTSDEPSVQLYKSDFCQLDIWSLDDVHNCLWFVTKMFCCRPTQIQKLAVSSCLLAWRLLGHRMVQGENNIFFHQVLNSCDHFLVFNIQYLFIDHLLFHDLCEEHPIQMGRWWYAVQASLWCLTCKLNRDLNLAWICWYLLDNSSKFHFNPPTHEICWAELRWNHLSPRCYSIAKPGNDEHGLKLKV